MAANNADAAAHAALSAAIAHEVQQDGAKDSEARLAHPLRAGPPAVELKELEADGVRAHDGDDEEYPTEDELHSLRRVPAAIPFTAYLIAFCELAERFSYYGVVQVFQNYIQRPRPPYEFGGYTGANTSPEGNTGALNQGQRNATAITTFNSFWVYVTPVIGAYIADSYLGRFKTIGLAVGIATVGHLILILNGIPTIMDNVDGALGCLIVAIIVSGVGTGFFKSNVSPLIAEQVAGKRQVIRVTQRGERVIVDPALSITRLFLWFYLCINVGAIGGQLGMSFGAKYIGFWFAFTLPTIVFLLCIPVLYFARHRYVKQPPAGSVLGNVFRLVHMAVRIRTKGGKKQDFWPNVMPSRFSSSERPRWMTFDDNWVLEVRRGLKACKVFLLFPIFWLCYNQINNNLISQAGVMVKNGAPNELVSQLNPLCIIIFVPILDLFFYPALRRMGINFTPIKRITVGFFCGSLAMIWAAVLQYFIYKTSPCGTDTAKEFPDGTVCDPAPISMWAQSFSYILISLAELFANVSGLEYAFTKAPKNMKSLVTSLYLLTTAIANAIGLALTPISEDPNLVINYGLFAGLSFAAGVVFWFWFRKLDAEENDLNNLSAGEYYDGQDAQREQASSSGSTRGEDAKEKA